MIDLKPLSAAIAAAAAARPVAVAVLRNPSGERFAEIYVVIADHDPHERESHGEIARTQIERKEKLGIEKNLGEDVGQKVDGREKAIDFAEARRRRR